MRTLYFRSPTLIHLGIFRFPTVCSSPRRSYQTKRSITMAPTVLIDMDNTLVDFDSEFGRRWAERRPEEGAAPVLDRAHFELEMNFDESQRPLAVEIMSQSGFFISFEPVPGALDAVRQMVDEGINVFFCTAPLPFQYETCVAEKFAWVRKYLGEDYLRRIIITRDKTVIKGAVLIDDKPVVTGACVKPEWTHIVFTRSYNKHIDAPRLTDWAQWRQIVGPLLESSK